MSPEDENATYPVFHYACIEIIHDQGIEFWERVLDVRQLFIQRHDVGLDVQCKLRLVDDVQRCCRQKPKQMSVADVQELERIDAL